jgi:hypothetical protein
MSSPIVTGMIFSGSGRNPLAVQHQVFIETDIKLT